MISEFKQKDKLALGAINKRLYQEYFMHTKFDILLNSQILIKMEGCI